MRIILSGGGSGGPVAPLLGLVETLKQTESTAECIWFGTATGPEQTMVAPYQLPFYVIAAGKYRRYFSIQNFIDSFRVIWGWGQSLRLLYKLKPDVVITVGAFGSVPTVWAASLLRIPCIVHQQDIIPGLANKLMANQATVITVTFEQSLSVFPAGKTQWIGNLVRPSVISGSAERARQTWQLEQNVPVVLIMGGGTGAVSLNQAVTDGLTELTNRCQIIHLTGAGKELPIEHSRYHGFPFLTDQMADALTVADVIVARAGLSSLTEFAAVGKAVLLVPMPGSHQEANADYFARQNAVRLLPTAQLTGVALTEAVTTLLSNPSDLAQLRQNIRSSMKWGANEAMVEIIRRLVTKA